MLMQCNGKIPPRGGALGPWDVGTLGVWVLGRWAFGCLGVWVFGRWAFGCLGVWVFGLWAWGLGVGVLYGVAGKLAWVARKLGSWVTGWEAGKLASS